MSVTVTESFALFSLWAATVAWIAVASFALGDAWLEYRITGKQYRFIRTFGNGRTIVARRRHRIAIWFLTGFAGCWLIGALAALGNLFAPPEQIDASLVSTVLRFFLVGVIFVFWRAKRNNRLLRRDLAAMEKQREEVEELKNVAVDSNETVHEVREKVDEIRERIDGEEESGG